MWRKFSWRKKFPQQPQPQKDHGPTSITQEDIDQAVQRLSLMDSFLERGLDPIEALYGHIAIFKDRTNAMVADAFILARAYMAEHKLEK